MRFSLVATVFILSSCVRDFQSQAMYEVNFQDGNVDNGLAHPNVYLNLTQTPRHECFYHCATDCICLAFQMFKDTDCQLLSNNRFTASLQRMPGHTFYDLTPWQAPGCSWNINCCRSSSNPCLNGATCLAPTEGEAGRFRCICQTSYSGNRCQYPTSCAAYRNTRTSGLYTMINPNSMQSFNVYCYFTWSHEDPGTVNSCTLIQTYALQNVSLIKTLTLDAPINENNFNWNAWRLSNANMKVLIPRSKWIITCDYEKQMRMHWEDYIRVRLDEIDILTENNVMERCINAERFSVRGYTCKQCPAMVTQTSLYPLHVNTDPSSRDECGGSIPNATVLCHEDSFGWYQCKNTDHRCAATSQSTTQTWLC